MPGTNLTREEALSRSAHLTVDSYLIELDLTTGEDSFASRTTVKFRSTQPGAQTFADLVDATISSITLNGQSIDPATAYLDSRIALSDLRACTGSLTQLMTGFISTANLRCPTHAGCSPRLSSPT